jgi:transposase
MLHKSRDLVARQRTMLINALRGHLAEYRIVTGIGAGGVTSMLKALHERQGELPIHARSALHGLAAQLRALGSEVGRLEAQCIPEHRARSTALGSRPN